MQFKHVRTGISGILLLTAVSSALYLVSTPRSSTADKGPISEFNVTKALAGEDTAYGSMRSDPDLRAMREELAVIRAQVAALTQREQGTARVGRGEPGMRALRRELTALRAQVTASTYGDAQEAGGMTPQVDLVDEQQAIVETQEHLQLMEGSFEAEGAAAGWAMEAEGLIYDALMGEEIIASLSDEAVAETSVQSVECRSTLCRLELLHDDRADLGEFRRQLISRTGGQFPSGSMHQIDQGATVVYLARDGYELPAY